MFGQIKTIRTCTKIEKEMGIHDAKRDFKNMGLIFLVLLLCLVLWPLALVVGFTWGLHWLLF